MYLNPGEKENEGVNSEILLSKSNFTFPFRIMDRDEGDVGETSKLRKLISTHGVLIYSKQNLSPQELVDFNNLKAPVVTEYIISISIWPFSVVRRFSEVTPQGMH